ncbi:MAG: ComEC/Rec2 family competence protein, partial [Verrucomicrobiia bacterium]
SATMPSLRGTDATRAEFPVHIEAIQLGDQWRPAHGTVLAQARVGDTLPACGDRIRAAGLLRLPFPPRNPGEFDRPSFLASRGIHLTWSLDPATLHIVEPRAGAFWRRIGLAVRDYMRNKVELGLRDDPEIAALMAGMLFGDREGIPGEVNEAFRRTGTIHLFAVSGQNIAVITGVLLLVLQVTGILRWRWGWTLIPVILLFCLGTGLQPSAVRASLMAGLVLVAWVLLRPISPLNLLGTAALMVWTWDPRQLFDLGFQLSFLVVLALVLAAAPLTSWWSRAGQPDPWIPPRLVPWHVRWIAAGWRAGCAALAVSVAAWAASAPLIAGHFHLVSLIGIAANLVIVPLASLVVIISGLSVAFGTIWTGFAILFNQVNWALLHLIVILVTALAAPPWAALYWNPRTALPPNETSIWVLDGQRAFPSIIRERSRAWLIDTGAEPVWRWTVDPARRTLGINRWDGVILTQASRSFAGGASALLADVPVAFWAESGWRSRSPDWHRWLDAMEQAGHPKQFWAAGDQIRLGPHLHLDVLWPPRDHKWTRLEDQGLVLHLHTPHGSVLWAGEISGQAEAAILENYPHLRTCILIQGEHSREANWTQAWLNTLTPQHLIRPRQGFQSDRSLTPQVWAWAQQHRAQLWLMDWHGAIHLTGREGQWEITPFLTPTVNPPHTPSPSGPTDKSPQSWPPRAAHPLP